MNKETSCAIVPVADDPSSNNSFMLMYSSQKLVLHPQRASHSFGKRERSDTTRPATPLVYPADDSSSEHKNAENTLFSVFP